MEMTIVSYYTDTPGDTYYYKVAKNLLTKCVDFKLPYQIEQLENTGSWAKNCLLKPPYLLRKLDELKSPILWLDADLDLVKKPEIAEVKGDIGVISGTSYRWHACVLLLIPTANTNLFLHNWCNLAAIHMHTNEHGDHTLLAVAADKTPGLKVIELPNWLNDGMTRTTGTHIRFRPATSSIKKAWENRKR
jgi:hypothetical protein